MKRAIFLGLGVAAGLGSVACQNVTGLSDLQFAQEPAPDGQGGSGGEPGGSGGQGGSGGSGQGGAGQAGSSVGGAGTGGSGGGAAGGGAGGSAGGGNCDQNQAPLVVLAATIQGSAGQEILLDASASSDPEQGTLSFSWEPLNGAPSLMDASSASPSLLVQECGDYSYKVTVSDACGASSEATVKVQVNTGGYVAKNACNPATACGGKSSPWCEIQEAVDSTQGALTIRVAGGQYAPVVLRAGVSLEGGYDDQFQARSTALDNLGTSIPLVEGSAIQGPLTGEAVVDGILITAGLTAPLPSLDAILLREQGALTLRNLKVVGGSPGQNVSKICAVARGSQGSGALVLGPGVEITALDALDTSAALCLEGTGDVTLTDVVLSGGTSNESLAIDASFSGTLQISGGSILGGPGVAYAAALRWHVTPPAPGAKLLVDGTTLRGGSGSKTVGLDLLGLGHAFLKNGVVSGEDPFSGGGLETVGIGLLASEVGEGLEPGVVLENSSIEGASAAQERTGILLDRSGLSATGGTIDGSTTPGGRRVIGLCSKGLTAGSGGISLKGLERVAGGAPDGAGQKYEAFGVELLSPTGATITGNKLITGCSSACKANAPASVAAAVHATQGNHSIEKNDALVGGPQSGGVAASLARHSGVFLELGCGEEKCAKFTISDNKAIVGNLAPAETPGIAVGIDGKGVQIIAKGNRIVGGYGAAQVTGLLMDQNKLSEVILNTIGGGVGKTAVGAFTSSQSSLLFTRNAVNACGVPLDGPEDDGCKLGDKSTGLISHNDSNSRISNNYTLGGFGLVASGCELGNNPDLTPSPAQFVYNLCLGIGRAGSSKAVGIQLLGLSGKGAAGLVVRNNIFLTANLATELYAGAEETVSSLTLTHNDFFLLDNPALGAGRALYKRNSSEFDATSQINVSSANVNSNSNVSLNPGFVAPTLNFSALTAADLHLKNDSSLKAKGVSISNELIDFDGEPRNNPEIGPDELP